MTIPTTIRGVDVYHGDTPLDFHALAAAGVKFIFIKATQGVSFVDPHFKDNWQRAGEVGLKRAPYHFFLPNADPVEQAQHLLRSAPDSYRYGLDIETAGANVGKNARACADEIKRATGRYPVPYSGDSFYQQYLKEFFPEDDFGLWIARYGKKPVTKCLIWQDADSLKIPNNRPLDGDLFYGTASDLDALLGQ